MELYLLAKGSVSLARSIIAFLSCPDGKKERDGCTGALLDVPNFIKGPLSTLSFLPIGRALGLRGGPAKGLVAA